MRAICFRRWNAISERVTRNLLTIALLLIVEPCAIARRPAAADDSRSGGPPVAARVDGQPILLPDIDAPSQTKIDKLRAQLTTTAAAALHDAIDERLRRASEAARAPTPAPVTDAASSAFRASHPEDFDGSRGPEAARRDSALERAAIRYHLEAEARGAAETEARRLRRQGHVVESAVPQSAELDEPLAPERTVARIDGQPVPAADLERAAALRLYRLRGEIYRERSRNLSEAIDALLLEREAARRGTTAGALLAGSAGPATVSDEEIDAFIARERAEGRPVPAGERARPYLEFQKSYGRRAALLDELRAKARIETLLRQPEVPLLPVEENGAPALGPAAGRRVAVYTNYRCRVCRAVHGELDRLRASDSSVRVVFRDLIPAYDPTADEAARLARCGAKLGRFEPVHRALLERDPPPFGTPWFSPAERADLARAQGIDPAAFDSCLTAPATSAAIANDTDEARHLGFDEAPAFVAEGIPLSGMQSADGLARALKQGAARQRRSAGL